jgi:hypothetical protein
MTTLILPANPLSGKGFDEEFQKEANAVRWEDDFQVASVDHDALTRRGKVTLRVPPTATASSIYRGWMLNTEQYETFYKQAKISGLTLETTPQQYRTAHRIDGWLDNFGDLTFPTFLVPEHNVEDKLAELMPSLEPGKYFIKDYVKSQKHDPKLSVANSVKDIQTVVNKLITEQGEWFTGGAVIRKFVELPANRTEIRGWWKDGEWRAFTPHPDFVDTVGETLDEVPDSLVAEVNNRLNELNLRFVSVDFTPTSDGDWLVIEIGDGQVSGFPSNIDEETIAEVLR